MTNIYLDMDGVMADLEQGLDGLFGEGRDRKVPLTNADWKRIIATPNFFFKLPPMEGAKEFFRSIQHLPNLYFLTSCPTSNYEEVARQKKAWVRLHLTHNHMVLPAAGSESKPLFMHNSGDILIDDWGKNCKAWEEAGGLAIKHEGTDFARTYACFLREYSYTSNYGTGREAAHGRGS